jgi:parallel beta-helix repeat protein
MTKSLFRSALSLTLLTGAAVAGPLNPPNGPITSSYKTLTEVEPRIAINAENTPGDADSTFRIAAAGSYYLDAPVSIASGKSGIEVFANNVTIDLNGFRLAGTNGSLSGIVLTGTTSVTIRNGTIYLMGGDGISAAGITSVRIEDVTCRENGGQGIAMGQGGQIFRCSTFLNGSHGINTADFCIVTDCVSRDNGGYGIDVDDSSVVTGCVASGNQQKGFGGNAGVTFANCTSVGNTQEGFYAHDFCIVRDCTARSNGLAGFALFQQPNATRCTSAGNGGAGFDLVFGGTIEGCNASFNGLNGIRVKGDGGYNAVLLLNNTCSSNSNSTGIYVEDASAVRIEGNHCNLNGSRGIHVTSANNVIVRNSCRGNTGGNYQFVAGNDYGVILTDPGAGFASSAAWANFAY